MPADGTRAAINNRGLRHHPDGSSSKNYSVSEGRTGDLSKFKKYFYGAPRSMKMGTIVSLGHYDGAASPRAPIDKSAMACDLALRLMLGSVPDFARSSDYPATGALSIDSVIDAMGQTRTSGRAQAKPALPSIAEIARSRSLSISNVSLGRVTSGLVCHQQAQRCIVSNALLAKEGHCIDLGTGIVVCAKKSDVLDAGPHRSPGWGYVLDWLFYPASFRRSIHSFLCNRRKRRRHATDRRAISGRHQRPRPHHRGNWHSKNRARS